MGKKNSNDNVGSLPHPQHFLLIATNYLKEQQKPNIVGKF